MYLDFEFDPIVGRILAYAKQKSGFTLVILFALITLTIADTDCEIMHSGFPVISATTCCTDNNGIVCANGRVTQLYNLPKLNSASLLMKQAQGQLPLDIGNITELTVLIIGSIDLSASQVPDSLALCTKLKRLRLVDCKLGDFPDVVRDLKVLGITIHLLTML